MGYSVIVHHGRIVMVLGVQSSDFIPNQKAENGESSVLPSPLSHLYSSGIQAGKDG